MPIAYSLNEVSEIIIRVLVEQNDNTLMQYAAFGHKILAIQIKVNST